jgi:GNAT superfamily N-acetyltransferase
VTIKEPRDARSIEIGPALPGDAPALTATSVAAFHDDALRFGGAQPGDDLSGPPGYDSNVWQRAMMKRGRDYAIRQGGRIVGGIIAFRLAGGVCNLGRIWVDPAAQGQGVGRSAIERLHRALPEVRTWTLETPVWAVRNHHLYESLGYIRVGENTEPDGFRQYLFERTVAAASGGDLGSTVTR